MARSDNSGAAETGEPWHSAIDTVLNRVIRFSPTAATENAGQDSVSGTCLAACRKILRRAKTRGYQRSDTVREQARRAAAARGGTWRLTQEFCRDGANRLRAR